MRLLAASDPQRRLMPDAVTMPEHSFTQRVANTLIVATVVLSTLVVWIVRDASGTTVLYTAPKLLALSVFGWLTVLVLGWALASGWRDVDWTRLLGQAPVWLLSLFVLCCSLSIFWSWVPTRTVFELNQWLLLFLLTLALVASSRLLTNPGRTLRWALIAAAAAVTLVGAIQAMGWLPWLLPISPQAGVSSPSLLGYKNPTAQVIAAQWFLLLYESLKATRGARRQRTGIRSEVWAALLWFLLLAEGLYLLRLLSRTTYLGWAAGGAVLCLYLAVDSRGLWIVGRRRRAKIAVLLLLVAVVLSVASLPDVRNRLESVVESAIDPDLAFSDRLVFWQNTMVMAAENPLGVGLGNWSVAYPVYREIARYRGFSTHERVRQAHSDPLQFLAEVGWLGLLLWLAVWSAALWSAGKGARTDLYGKVLIAQGVCLFVVHTADFPFQHPSNRAFFWWWLALVLLRALGTDHESAPAARATQTPRTYDPVRARRAERAAVSVFRWALVGLVVLELVGHVSLYSYSLKASGFSRIVQRAKGLEAAGSRSPQQFAKLVEAQAVGAAVLRSPVGLMHPTNAQHWTLLAETCQRLGDLACQAHAAERALKTAPFEPIAMRQLAAALRGTDPSAAAQWLRLALYVDGAATRGVPSEYDQRRAARLARPRESALPNQR